MTSSNTAVADMTSDVSSNQTMMTSSVVMMAVNASMTSSMMAEASPSLENMTMVHMTSELTQASTSMMSSSMVTQESSSVQPSPSSSMVDGGDSSSVVIGDNTTTDTKPTEGEKVLIKSGALATVTGQLVFYIF